MAFLLARSGPAPRPHLLAALGPAGRARAEAFLAACPAHRPTPLATLPGLAANLGIGALYLKDEGRRLGLKSFKALGGAYAVMRLALERASARLGRGLAPAELHAPDVRAAIDGLVVACATDGNHGRAVAAGARLSGCRSVVFVHEGVSAARADAIAAHGARIVRVPGGYDASVVEAARRAAEAGWTVVSDTSREGDEAIPLTVMQGYTVMIGEALDALGTPPTHVFVQAGVGGVAAAVAAHVRARLGDGPRIVVVEPERAACVMASARAGRPMGVAHGPSTVMAMLECHEASPIAIELLLPLADAYVSLPDEAAIAAMRRLARPVSGDPAIVAGESGGAGFAGLVHCLADPGARGALGLGPASRVLCLVTEGATDPVLWREIVGLDPDPIGPAP